MFLSLLLHPLIAIHRIQICLLSHFPEISQKRTLRKILKRSRKTAFGKTYGFAEITNAEIYARLIPINQYEDIRPFVERIVAGERNVLTTRKFTSITTTSGTTGKPKIIPQYKEMQRNEYLQAIVGMLDCVYRADPLALHTPLAIIVAGRETGRGQSPTIHAASANETYRKNIFARCLAIPPDVFDIEDSSTKYYYCALFAMQSRSGVILTPNPTTVLRILSISREFQSFLHLDLESHSLHNRFAIPAAQFERIDHAWRRAILSKTEIGNHTTTFVTNWRFLRTVVCWKGGSAGFYIDQVTKHFDHRVNIIDLGYLASDSPLTVSASGTKGQLLMAGNVYAEFQLADDTCGPLYQYHELREGLEYVAIVTNAYGMYRYHTQDVFRVVGKKNRAPTLEFVRKVSGFANITGEKLSESQALICIQAISEKIQNHCHLFVGIPLLAEIRYCFYMELAAPSSTPIEHIERALDDELASVNLEYAGKRASGRLHSPIVRLLQIDAYEKIKSHLVEHGVRDVQFKLVLLQADDRLKPLLDQLASPLESHSSGGSIPVHPPYRSEIHL